MTETSAVEIPQTSAILVLGTSDQAFFGIPLPAALPGGGCELLVAADIVALSLMTNAQGSATQPLPIPANSGLNGQIVFAQWIHLIGGPLIAATDSFALHVFP